MDSFLSCSTSTGCSTSAPRRRPRERISIGHGWECNETENRSGLVRAAESEETMETGMIVDDSSVSRKVARRILEGLDFQITEAENGEEAIETCRRALPDAILLDWNMPKMDGYDFLRVLRRLRGGDGPKVVFCTTENDVAHIARALHAGANEYIMKPFDKDIVQAKFEEVGLI